jgi:UDP-N-acetylmuramate: L-alanyl-gamma-D-glutamyl-meso-diaminopimelate ligase
MTCLEVLQDGNAVMKVETPLYGNHNLSNLLSCVVLAETLGIERGDLLQALRTFRGVKRRQEIKGEHNGILVLDDFAHHPTAVSETIRAVRERFKQRRVVAIFEPRSNSSRRKVFQDAYTRAFDGADLIFVPDPPMPEKTPREERFSSGELVEALQRRGLDAVYSPDTAVLLEEILRRRRAGDVLLFMSNGSFDNLPARVLERLKN